MIAQATTVIDVFRDATAATLPEGSQTYDQWGNETETPRDTGDPAQADDPYLRGLTASIIEKMQRRPDPTTGDLRVIRYITGRVTAGTDIRPGDIIADRKTGARYGVREAMQPANPVMKLDLHLDLVKTG